MWFIIGPQYRYIMKNDDLWVDIYRPQTIKQTILPPRLKKAFQNMVDKRKLPHLILTGKPGLGKTTVALALCNDTESEYLFLDCSTNGSIDTIRTKVSRFCATPSLINPNSPKTVIFDEADRLTPAAQDALKGSIEAYQKTVRFIFTSNHRNKLIEAIHSRCDEIEYNFTSAERKVLWKELYVRLGEILDEQNVEYDAKALAAFIKEHFPDMRKIITRLDNYSISGHLDTGMLGDSGTTDLDSIIKFCRGNDYTNVCIWVDENYTKIGHRIHTDLWIHRDTYFTTIGSASIITHLNDFQINAPIVSDPKINMVSLLTKIMLDADFKK